MNIGQMSQNTGLKQEFIGVRTTYTNVTQECTVIYSETSKDHSVPIQSSDAKWIKYSAVD